MNVKKKTYHVSLRSRGIVIAILILFAYPITDSGNLFCQQKSDSIIVIDPIQIVSGRPIRFTEAKFENMTPLSGEVYGLIGYEETRLRDIEPLETIELSIRNYEAIKFLMTTPSGSKKSFSIATLGNKKFEVDIDLAPGLERVDNIINVKTNNLKKLKGNKIFDVVISDDVLPIRIKVESARESSPFISVMPSADPSVFQVRLKSGAEIDGLLKDKLNKLSSNAYLEIPVWLRIFDPEIPGKEQDLPYKYVLRYKPKKQKK